MKFGMNVPIFGEYADPQLLAALAVEAEDAGWDGFWVWDHLQWSGEDDGRPRPPAVDPTVALALVAAATSRVRIGPMVLPLARLPVTPADFPLLDSVLPHDPAHVRERSARDPHGFPWLDEPAWPNRSAAVSTDC